MYLIFLDIYRVYNNVFGINILFEGCPNLAKRTQVYQLILMINLVRVCLKQIVANDVQSDYYVSMSFKQ